MAIPLFGSVGALFNALGKIGGLVKNTYSTQQLQFNDMTNTTNGIVTQFTGESDLQALVGDNYLSQLSGLEGPCALAQIMAQAIIDRKVYRDNPQFNQNLTSQNLPASIAYVIQQMRSQGATILAMTVTGTAGAITGTGTGAINVSVKRPFDGKLLENAFAETITFTCTSDSYIGGATPFNEGFTVTGQGSEPDIFAFDWPLGSNGSITINAIDGDTSNGSGNLLANSGFATFVNTANVPDQWALAVGTAGTNTQQNTTIVYSGANSLQWIGTAGTLISLTQAFNNANGNSSTLSPQTQYSVNLFLRTGAVAPATGVLQVDLIDGNGNIIPDQAGNNNSFTINLTTLNTVWTAFSGSFRTPEVLPVTTGTTTATQTIRYHLTTAMNAGATFYMAKTSMGLHNQLYVQGPFVALHSGNTPFVQSPIPDTGTAVITNSRGAAGTLSTFQTLLFQLLPSAAAAEVIWPSSASPNISDALIS